MKCYIGSNICAGILILLVGVGAPTSFGHEANCDGEDNAIEDFLHSDTSAKTRDVRTESPMDNEVDSVFTNDNYDDSYDAKYCEKGFENNRLENEIVPPPKPGNQFCTESPADVARNLDFDESPQKTPPTTASKQKNDPPQSKELPSAKKESPQEKDQSLIWIVIIFLILWACRGGR